MPTFSEFEILRDAFIALGVPTVICDPRDLEFAAGSRFSAGTGRGLYANGERIDLVYRRVLINDILARQTECRALLDGYRSGTVCVANSLRCKIPHKKAFFAVLTDERYAGLFSGGRARDDPAARAVDGAGGGAAGERGRPVGGPGAASARATAISS